MLAPVSTHNQAGDGWTVGFTETGDCVVVVGENFIAFQPRLQDLYALATLFSRQAARVVRGAASAVIAEIQVKSLHAAGRNRTERRRADREARRAG